MERGKLDSLNLHDEFEWDTKTIASGIKGYLSKYLGEPLLTFDFYIHFVEAASEWCGGEYMYRYMRGSSFFLEKVTALGVLCCFALLFV